MRPRHKLQFVRSAGPVPAVGRLAWELGVALKTAMAHRANLMEKLAIHDTANLVRFAIRTGVCKP